MNGCRVVCVEVFVLGCVIGTGSDNGSSCDVDDEMPLVEEEQEPDVEYMGQGPPSGTNETTDLDERLTVLYEARMTRAGTGNEAFEVIPRPTVFETEKVRDSSFADKCGRNDPTKVGWQGRSKGGMFVVVPGEEIRVGDKGIQQDGGVKRGEQCKENEECEAGLLCRRKEMYAGYGDCQALESTTGFLFVNDLGILAVVKWDSNNCALVQFSFWSSVASRLNTNPTRIIVFDDSSLYNQNAQHQSNASPSKLSEALLDAGAVDFYQYKGHAILLTGDRPKDKEAASHHWRQVEETFKQVFSNDSVIASNAVDRLFDLYQGVFYNVMDGRAFWDLSRSMAANPEHSINIYTKNKCLKKAVKGFLSTKSISLRRLPNRARSNKKNATSCLDEETGAIDNNVCGHSKSCELLRLNCRHFLQDGFFRQHDKHSRTSRFAIVIKQTERESFNKDGFINQFLSLQDTQGPLYDI